MVRRNSLCYVSRRPGDRRDQPQVRQAAAEAAEIPVKIEGGNILFDFWPCPRPMTGKWGSGQVWDRICNNLGQPDVAFGKTDGIPNGVLAVMDDSHLWESLEPLFYNMAELIVFRKDKF